MAYIASKTYTPSSGSSLHTWSLLRINGGLNLEDDEYQLNDNQSHDCQNVYFRQRFCKRPGYTTVSSTGASAAIGWAFGYLYKSHIIYQSGTSLYSMSPGIYDPTVIYTGLTALADGVFGTFFQFNGYLYYINGHEFIKYDGATVSTITPYIPVVIINRKPSGGGTANEDYNSIGSGFTNWFNGDGSSTVYTLTDSGLDAKTVTCTVGGVAKTEGTDFTVNRTLGTVTFNTAPPAISGSSNNVIITAYKTRADYVQRIYTCTAAIAFGGSNDNRLFFAGNGTANYYWTDVAKPEYFPMSQYNAIGTSDDPVTQFGIQNDTLVIFKARSIYGATYQFDTSTAKAYFPVVSLNAMIGCDCPGSVCLINNRLVFVNTYRGAFTLVNQFTGVVSGNIYRNVEPISRNINGNSRRSGLLQESNLESAVAVDFDDKYWLAVNGKIYLWDYGTTPYASSKTPEEAQRSLAWWRFTNLPIRCFIQDGGTLWFGGSDTGKIRQFIDNFMDDGAAITAWWQMGINTFSTPNRYKKIKRWWCSCKSDTAQTIQITYYYDDNQTGMADPEPIIVKPSFSWATFRWDQFSWGVAHWFTIVPRRPGIKNTKAFSIRFANANIAEDMNLSDLIVEFTATKKVR